MKLTEITAQEGIEYGIYHIIKVDMNRAGESMMENIKEHCIINGKKEIVVMVHPRNEVRICLESGKKNVIKSNRGSHYWNGEYIFHFTAIEWDDISVVLYVDPNMTQEEMHVATFDYPIMGNVLFTMTKN